VFLLWAISELKERYGGSAAVGSDGLGPVLTGIDVDPVAVETCRRVLGNENPRDANIQCRVLQSDFLRDDVLPGDANGFDIIMGNPPWVSLKGKHGKEIPGERDPERLVERYGADRYRPNLAELFIHRSWDLLQPGGLLAFVLPDRIAANLQFENLRRRLLVEGTILELEFGLRMPDVVSDIMTCIIRKEPCATGHIVRWRLKGREERRPQRDLLERQWKTWTPPGEASGLEWLEDSVPLGSLFCTSVGLIARAGTITDERTGRDQMRIMRGRDIVPYQRTGGAWFRFERENLAGGTQNIRKLGASPKILVRKTGDRIVAAMDETGDYPEQSLYFLYEPKEDVCWEVVLAWLNSSILDEYVKSELLTNRDSMAQLKKVHLDRVPVPKALLGGDGFPEWSRQLVDAVRKRMEIGGKNGAAQERDAEIDGIIQKRVGGSETAGPAARG
jgi:hypothetical protein